MATVPMSLRLTPRERDAVRRLKGADPAWLFDRDKRADGPDLPNGDQRPNYLAWLLVRALRDAEARVDAGAELKAELDQQVADDPSVEPDDVDYSDRDVVLAAWCRRRIPRPCCSKWSASGVGPAPTSRPTCSPAPSRSCHERPRARPWPGLLMAMATARLEGVPDGLKPVLENPTGYAGNAIQDARYERFEIRTRGDMAKSRPPHGKVRGCGCSAKRIIRRAGHTAENPHPGHNNQQLANTQSATTRVPPRRKTETGISRHVAHSEHTTFNPPHSAAPGSSIVTVETSAPNAHARITVHTGRDLDAQSSARKRISLATHTCQAAAPAPPNTRIPTVAPTRSARTDYPIGLSRLAEATRSPALHGHGASVPRDNGARSGGSAHGRPDPPHSSTRPSVQQRPNPRAQAQKRRNHAAYAF